MKPIKFKDIKNVKFKKILSYQDRLPNLIERGIPFTEAEEKHRNAREKRYKYFLKLQEKIDRYIFLFSNLSFLKNL